MGINFTPGPCDGKVEYEEKTEETTGEAQASGSGVILKGEGKVGGSKKTTTTKYVCTPKSGPPQTVEEQK
jgi:hypothetical protein